MKGILPLSTLVLTLGNGLFLLHFLLILSRFQGRILAHFRVQFKSSMDSLKIHSNFCPYF